MRICCAFQVTLPETLHSPKGVDCNVKKTLPDNLIKNNNSVIQTETRVTEMFIRGQYEIRPKPQHYVTILPQPPSETLCVFKLITISLATANTL